MQRTMPVKPVFTVRELYAETIGVYKKAAGTLICASFIGGIMPLLLIALMVYACCLPIINGYEGYKYLELWGTSQYMNHVPAWQWMLVLSGALMALLFIFIWSIVLYPRFIGGMVIATGNARRGTRVSLGFLLTATGNGRFGQLIVVGLCLYLTNMLCSVAVSIITNVIGLVFTLLASAVSIFGGFLSLTIIVSMLLILLITVGMTVVPSVFMSLTYPVAVCENQRHFNAVIASFRYVSRAFWRVFAGVLPVMALFFVLYVALLIITSVSVITGFYWLYVLWITIALVSALFITPFQYIYNTLAYLRIREAQGYGVTIGRDQTIR